jgi:microcystin-dependent protein
MSQPFLGEVKLIAWNYPPKGWAFCNGQFLPINQNQALFSLLGTTYGGNGQTTFALPDLRSRTPIHMGSGFTQGQKGGEEFHTLSINELPTHLHALQGSNNNGSSQTAANNVLGVVAGRLYTDPANLTPLAPSSVTNVGGSQPHENRQPYLVVNAIVALQGIFPSQN